MDSANTPSEDLFLQLYVEEEKPLEEAAFLAWPALKEPMLRAKAFIQDNELTRARFHAYLDNAGITDDDIARQLAKALILAEDDPKASAAVLNVCKELLKVKDLYPKQASIKEQLGLGGDISQINIVNQYLDRARESGLSQEDIDQMTTQPVIDVEVVEKKDLFE